MTDKLRPRRVYQVYPTALLFLLFRTKTLSLFCETQKRESAVITINRKDLINSYAYWGFEVNFSANRE